MPPARAKRREVRRRRRPREPGSGRRRRSGRRCGCTIARAALSRARTEFPSERVGGVPRRRRASRRPLCAKNATGFRHTMVSIVGRRRSLLAHHRHRLRHLERVADAPIGGAVDDDARRCRSCCTSAAMRGSSILLSGIDRVARPAAGRRGRAASVSSLLWSIEHAFLGKPDLADERQACARCRASCRDAACGRARAARSARASSSCAAKQLLLGRRSARRSRSRRPRRRRPSRGSAAAAPSTPSATRVVVRLLRVQRQRAEVADAELARAERAPSRGATRSSPRTCRRACAAGRARTPARRWRRCPAAAIAS